jgi:hypothetical protein
MNAVPIRTPLRAALLLALRALLIVWAGFWAWFVLAVSYGGSETPPPLWIPVVGLGALALLCLLGWKRPTAGGIALVATGLAAAAFFANPWARALLALPAILLGAGFLALRWRYSTDPGKRDLYSA